MAFDFDQIGDDAIALIKEFSKPSTLVLQRSIDGAPPDATKPWRVGTPSVLTFNVQGAVIPFPQETNAPTVDQDLTVIVPGDAAAIKANEDNTKALTRFLETDRMVVDDQTYEVKGAPTLRPGTNVIMFKLRLRVWQSITIQRSTQL